MATKHTFDTTEDNKDVTTSSSRTGAAVPTPSASASRTSSTHDLAEKLRALVAEEPNPALQFQRAVELLLEHVADDEVKAAFRAIPRNI